MKKHNFSAGPSILSPYTIKNTADGILDLDNSGLSVMEISHRSKEFMAIMDETQQLFVELLDIPEATVCCCFREEPVCSFAWFLIIFCKPKLPIWIQDPGPIRL